MSSPIFLGKKIGGLFTIPAGIITTTVPAIKLIARKIPSIGIITTKSIGLKPRAGNREPILAQYGQKSWLNAVGLTNPGADAFAQELKNLQLPVNKFLLSSIFGSTAEEFLKVAQKLQKYVDGFELNLSCPHDQKYGQTVGENPDIVYRAVKAIVSLRKPVLIKVSVNIPLRPIIKAATAAGTNGFVAINTVGPRLHLHEGRPVLTNQLGGLSGKAILPMGLKCIREIRSLSKLPIIGCGGITNVTDLKNYQKAGANFFGIGTALAGMTTEEIKKYFALLNKDFQQNTNLTEKKIKTGFIAQYHPFKIKKKIILTKNLFLLKLNEKFLIKPGQFVFLWLPEVGEKPFSLLENQPATFFIKKRGILTKKLAEVSLNTRVYLRGPYGKGFNPKGKILLVGGGTGICSLLAFAKANPHCFALLGVKTKKSLPSLNLFKKYCQSLLIASEDGQLGKKGMATDFLKEVLEHHSFDYCFNCGSEIMVKKAVAIEKKYLAKSKIYSAIDFLTRCGLGLCGSCTTSKGYRSCVDGPFMNLSQM